MFAACVNDALNAPEMSSRTLMVLLLEREKNPTSGPSMCTCGSLTALWVWHLPVNAPSYKHSLLGNLSKRVSADRPKTTRHGGKFWSLHIDHSFLNPPLNRETNGAFKFSFGCMSQGSFQLFPHCWANRSLDLLLLSAAMHILSFSHVFHQVSTQSEPRQAATKQQEGQSKKMNNFSRPGYYERSLRSFILASTLLCQKTNESSLPTNRRGIETREEEEEKKKKEKEGKREGRACNSARTQIDCIPLKLCEQEASTQNRRQQIQTRSVNHFFALKRRERKKKKKKQEFFIWELPTRRFRCGGGEEGCRDCRRHMCTSGNPKA